jgi:hypothetical protein
VNVSDGLCLVWLLQVVLWDVNKVGNFGIRNPLIFNDRLAGANNKVGNFPVDIS